MLSENFVPQNLCTCIYRGVIFLPELFQKPQKSRATRYMNEAERDQTVSVLIKTSDTMNATQRRDDPYLSLDDQTEGKLDLDH